MPKNNFINTNITQHVEQVQNASRILVIYCILNISIWSVSWHTKIDKLRIVFQKKTLKQPKKLWKNHTQSWNNIQFSWVLRYGKNYSYDTYPLTITCVCVRFGIAKPVKRPCSAVLDADAAVFIFSSACSLATILAIISKSWNWKYFKTSSRTLLFIQFWRKNPSDTLTYPVSARLSAPTHPF